MYQRVPTISAAEGTPGTVSRGKAATIGPYVPQVPGAVSSALFQNWPTPLALHDSPDGAACIKRPEDRKQRKCCRALSLMVSWAAG